MKIAHRAIALTELLFIFPGLLFMAALFLREIQPAPFEPAQTARHIVDWYSTHGPLGLDVFLIALPFLAFVIGCATVLHAWRTDPQLRLAARETLSLLRPHLATLFTAVATLLAGGILTIVALHLMTE